MNKRHVEHNLNESFENKKCHKIKIKFGAIIQPLKSFQLLFCSKNKISPAK